MRLFQVSIIVMPELGECGAETRHVIGIMEANNVGEARSKLDVDTQEERLQLGQLGNRNPRVETLPLRRIYGTELREAVDRLN